MVFQTALRSLSNRSKVVVGNYCSSPITAEQYREKVRPLRPRRSYFAPAKARFRVARWRALVEAPGTAPGSEWFIATAIYFHSRRTGTPNIRRGSKEKQCRMGACKAGVTGHPPRGPTYGAPGGFVKARRDAGSTLVVLTIIRTFSGYNS